MFFRCSRVLVTEVASGVTTTVVVSEKDLTISLIDSEYQRFSSWVMIIRLVAPPIVMVPVEVPQVRACGCQSPTWTSKRGRTEEFETVTVTFEAWPTTGSESTEMLVTATSGFKSSLSITRM